MFITFYVRLLDVQKCFEGSAEFPLPNAQCSLLLTFYVAFELMK